jgi:hypothetical protein
MIRMPICWRGLMPCALILWHVLSSYIISYYIISRHGMSNFVSYLAKDALSFFCSVLFNAYREASLLNQMSFIVWIHQLCMTRLTSSASWYTAVLEGQSGLKTFPAQKSRLGVLILQGRTAYVGMFMHRFLNFAHGKMGVCLVDVDNPSVLVSIFYSAALLTFHVCGEGAVRISSTASVSTTKRQALTSDGICMLVAHHIAGVVSLSTHQAPTIACIYPASLSAHTWPGKTVP